MSYLNAALGIGEDLYGFSNFDRRDPMSYVSKAEGTGGLLGAGVGLLATPFLGPGGVILGRGIGKMIGRKKGMKQAQELIDRRKDRQTLQMNMFEDLANQKAQSAAVENVNDYLSAKSAANLY